MNRSEWNKGKRNITKFCLRCDKPHYRPKAKYCHGCNPATKGYSRRVIREIEFYNTGLIRLPPALDVTRLDPNNDQVIQRLENNQWVEYDWNYAYDDENR